MLPEIASYIFKTATTIYLDKIKMKEAHNKIFEVRGIKVIALYHPSGANRFINMSLYKQQLKAALTQLF